MADFSFQFFSPLRDSAVKKKKKKRHSEEAEEELSFLSRRCQKSGHKEEIEKINSNDLTVSESPKRKHKKHKKNTETGGELSQEINLPSRNIDYSEVHRNARREVPVVPSSNVDSDSNIDEDILKLASELTSSFSEENTPTKRKIKSGGTSPSKKSRLSKNVEDSLTSSQVSGRTVGHSVSSSDESDEQSQSILKGSKPTHIAAMSALRRSSPSPDLFSNLGSDTDTPLHMPFIQTSTSPIKQPLASSKVGMEKGSPCKQPTASPKQSPLKTSKPASEDSSSSSDSDMETEPHRKGSANGQQVSPVATQNQQASSSSDSASESDSEEGIVAENVPPPPPPQKEPPKSFRYECPMGFKEVEFADAPLTVEDLADDKEIWLLQLPSEFDVSKLHGKNFMTDAVMQVGRGKESDVQFEVHSSRTQKKKHKTSLLLPSKADKKLHYAGQVNGQMWLSESHNIPSVVMPKAKRQRDTSLPPGLKFRNIPFGAGSHNTTRFTSIDTGSSQRKHKKKKRERASKEKTMDTVEPSAELDDTLEDDSQIESERKKAKKKKKKHKKDKHEQT